MEKGSNIRRGLPRKIDRRAMLQAMAGSTVLGAEVQLAGSGGDRAAGAASQQGRASLSLAHRIPGAHWREDERFAVLLKALNAHRRAVDEIALGDGSGFWSSPERIERSNEILKRRIAQFKEAGWRAGINVGVTMGHGNNNNPSMPPLPFQPTVGHDGQVSDACPCPNDPNYRAHISKKYELMARTNPDFIWLDDDLRVSHHGPTYPCFCPICLKLFGHGTVREALVKQLNAPAGGDLRRAWTQFMADSVNGVCADIQRAVVQVNASIEIGEMTIGYSHSTYGGYPINRWMQTLGARRGRPGHGYYTDQPARFGQVDLNPALLDKAFDVGRQVRDYPPEVEIIQHELETYPHIPLDKATRTIINECTVALMMGCTGIAFTLFPFTELVSYEDYDGLLGAVSRERPAWEALLEARQDLLPAGFWPADNRLLMANRQVDQTGWFWEHGVYEIQQPNETIEMGLPMTTDPQAACGVLLSGKVAEAFTTDELRGFLAKAVLMDGFALGVLWQRGLGELTGVKPGERIPAGITERLTNHPLNGHYAGDRRDVLAGPSDGVSSLVPVAEGVGDLAHLVRSGGSDAGICFSTYQNALGGRVAVSTFGPWHRQGRSATRHRLLAVGDWLVNGRLPVLIEPTVRTAPLVRMSADGKRFALLLFNPALDPTGPLTVRVRTRARQVFLVDQGKVTPLPSEREGKDMVLRLASVPPSQTAIVLGSG
jgi:hypothetical protein